MFKARMGMGLVAVVFGLGTMVAYGHGGDEGGDAKVPAEARQELAQVRQATTQYHDIANAEAEGFVPASPYVPGMGYHYASFARLATGFDHQAPEVLLYVPTEDGMELVGVEYVVFGPEAPAGFAGHADHWVPSHAVPGAWELHAWVWRGNPDGVFSPFNPNVP